MLKKAAEKELAAVGDNYKSQLSHLRDELYEKTTLYEEMMERHLAEMRAKQVPPITQQLYLPRSRQDVQCFSRA